MEINISGFVGEKERLANEGTYSRLVTYWLGPWWPVSEDTSDWVMMTMTSSL